MLVLLLIIFRKRKRVRKIKLGARFFIHGLNIFIRFKDVYFAVEKPPIQLEKQTQKRKEKITFSFIFRQKRRRLVSSFRLLFLGGARGKEVLGSSSSKKKKKTTPSSIEEELNNARLKIKTLRTIRSYSPHFRVPCILSSVFFQAFR